VVFAGVRQHSIGIRYVIHRGSPTQHGQLLWCLQELAHTTWAFAMFCTETRQRGMDTCHVVCRSSPTQHGHFYVVDRARRHCMGIRYVAYRLPPQRGHLLCCAQGPATQHGHLLCCLQIANTAWAFAMLFRGSPTQHGYLLCCLKALANTA